MKLFKDKKVWLILFIVLIFFGTLCKLNFSVDTYLLFAAKDLSYMREFLQSGRIITTIFFTFLMIFKLDINIIYFISYILAITFSTLSIYNLYKLVLKYTKREILSLIVSVLIIINPFIIELWLFAEAGIMMFAIYSSVKAVTYFDRYLESKSNKNLIYSILFMLLSVSSYQGVVALFTSLSVILIINKSKNIKEFILNNIMMLLTYAIPSIINLLFINIFKSDRVGNHNILDSIKLVLKSTDKLFLNAFGLFPSDLFKVFILIAILLLIISILYNSKSRLKLIIGFIYAILMLYIFSVLPLIFQSVEDMAMYPRSIYAFASLIGIIILYYSLNIENIKYITYIFITISILVLVIELTNFIKIEMNRYRVNEEDREIILSINDKINKYEEETKYKITKLVIYNQDNSTKFYSDIKDNINVSAISESPSNLALLTFYTHKKFELIDENKYIYDFYFKNKNWEKFNLDQVVLIQDTMYWYLY